MSTPQKHVWAGLYHDTEGKYPPHQTLLENPEGTFKAIVRYPPPTTPPPITPAGYAPVNQDQMAEVRVRPARKAGKLNFGDELRQLLYAHGDDQDPLEETVKVLDDIVTDYIVEACHGAARVATIAGRQKVKVDDFRVVFRKDAIKLGRMLDLDKTAKEQKEQRKMFDPNDDRVEKAGFAFAEALGDLDTDEEDTTATAAAAGVAGGAEDAAVGKKRKRGKGDDTDGKAKGKKKVKEV